MSLFALIGETPTVDITPITTAITSAITPVQVITILAGAITAVMGFVLMYLAVRKVGGMFNAALYRGKIRA